MARDAEKVLSNARIVLAGEIVRGEVHVRGGRIEAVSSPGARGEDMEGDYLIPGLVELHTDHLEGHYAPRPGVRWNAVAAVQAHDAQIAASGITTVFDALRVGTDGGGEMGPADMLALAGAVRESHEAERLRAEHFIHLRCEVSAPDCLDQFERLEHEERVRLVSLMDHAPNQRQFASIDSYRPYYQGKLGMSDEAFNAFVARRIDESARHSARHRAEIVARAGDRGITLASHDDATVEHVGEAIGQGIRVAEFPTTLEAAAASHEAGLSVLMGAPNVVRGSSHTGNISARALAERGLLDILSSDYVPFSLVQAAFSLDGLTDAITLTEAVALVTRRPAEAVGLTDRGEIAAGKRADLVRVRLVGEVPVVRAVWREGVRVI